MIHNNFYKIDILLCSNFIDIILLTLALISFIKKKNCLENGKIHSYQQQLVNLYI